MLQTHKIWTTSFYPCSHKPSFLCVITPDIFQFWRCFYCCSWFKPIVPASWTSLPATTVWFNTALVTLSFMVPSSTPQKPNQEWLHWLLLDVSWYCKSFSAMLCFFLTYYLMVQGWNTVILMVIMSHFIHIFRMKRLYMGYCLNIPGSFKIWGSVLICSIWTRIR